MSLNEKYYELMDKKGYTNEENRHNFGYNFVNHYHWNVGNER